MTRKLQVQKYITNIFVGTFSPILGEGGRDPPIFAKLWSQVQKYVINIFVGTFFPILGEGGRDPPIFAKL